MENVISGQETVNQYGCHRLPADNKGSEVFGVSVSQTQGVVTKGLSGQTSSYAGVVKLIHRVEISQSTNIASLNEIIIQQGFEGPDKKLAESAISIVEVWRKNGAEFVVKKIKEDKVLQNYNKASKGEVCIFGLKSCPNIIEVDRIIVWNPFTKEYSILKNSNDVTDDVKNNCFITAVISRKAKGIDLYEYLKINGRKTNFNDLLNIVVEVGRALKFFNEKKFVYRDLKAENVIYDPASKRVTLIDLGFVKHLGIIRRTKSICGTPGMIAPEITSRILHRFFSKFQGKSDFPIENLKHRLHEWGNKTQGWHDLRVDAWAYGGFILGLFYAVWPGHFCEKSNAFITNSPRELCFTYYSSAILSQKTQQEIVSILEKTPAQFNRGDRDPLNKVNEIIASLLNFEPDGRMSIHDAFQQLDSLKQRLNAKGGAGYSVKQSPAVLLQEEVEKNNVSGQSYAPAKTISCSASKDLSSALQALGFRELFTALDKNKQIGYWMKDNKEYAIQFFSQAGYQHTGLNQEQIFLFENFSCPHIVKACGIILKDTNAQRFAFIEGAKNVLAKFTVLKKNHAVAGIIFEKVNGSSLFRCQQNGNELALEDLLQVSVDVCKFFHYLNGKNRVYQNLHARNVIYDADNKETTVINMTTVKELDSSGQAKSVAGDIRMMPPEALQKNWSYRLCSERWLVGAFLLNLLTGGTPGTYSNTSSGHTFNTGCSNDEITYNVLQFALLKKEKKQKLIRCHQNMTKNQPGNENIEAVLTQLIDVIILLTKHDGNKRMTIENAYIKLKAIQDQYLTAPIK